MTVQSTFFNSVGFSGVEIEEQTNNNHPENKCIIMRATNGGIASDRAGYRGAVKASALAKIVRWIMNFSRPENSS